MTDSVGFRTLVAPNPSTFTLDGTCTYIVGERIGVVIDPGPSDPTHLADIRTATREFERVVVLLTHDHIDHAQGAAELGGMLGSRVHGPGGDVAVHEGTPIETDHGPLLPVDTPGHSRHHFAYHWPDRRALFVGDLMLGAGNTTWVGEYPGCVRDYLASLDRLSSIDVDVLYPGHGGPISDPDQRIDLFRKHRLLRIRQVAEVLQTMPDATAPELIRAVYGELPQGVSTAAETSVEAILDYLRSPGVA